MSKDVRRKRTFFSEEDSLLESLDAIFLGNHSSIRQRGLGVALSAVCPATREPCQTASESFQKNSIPRSIWKADILF